MSIMLRVNDSLFAGRRGEFTSRHLRERLDRELRTDVARVGEGRPAGASVLAHRATAVIASVPVAAARALPASRAP